MDKKPDEIYCPNCAKPIKKDAAACPYCGVQVKELGEFTRVEESNDENEVVRLLIEGKRKSTIVRMLIKKGWIKDKATRLVNGIQYNLRKENPGYRKTLAKKYKGGVIGSIILFLLWSVLTWIVLRANVYIFEITVGYLIFLIFCFTISVLSIIYFVHSLVFWLRYRI
jgi:hypothetical protein